MKFYPLVVKLGMFSQFFINNSQQRFSFYSKDYANEELCPSIVDSLTTVKSFKYVYGKSNYYPNKYINIK